MLYRIVTCESVTWRVDYFAVLLNAVQSSLVPFCVLNVQCEICQTLLRFTSLQNMSV